MWDICANREMFLINITPKTQLLTNVWQEHILKLYFPLPFKIYSFLKATCLFLASNIKEVCTSWSFPVACYVLGSKSNILPLPPWKRCAKQKTHLKDTRSLMNTQTRCFSSFPPWNLSTYVILYPTRQYRETLLIFATCPLHLVPSQRGYCLYAAPTAGYVFHPVSASLSPHAARWWAATIISHPLGSRRKKRHKTSNKLKI